MKGKIAKNIDEYIADFPADIQARLEKLRTAIHKAAPMAAETISYAIPTFTLDGILVHFAGFKNHIGFYPGSAAIESFKKEVEAFDTSKGTIQFPHDKPIPIGLVSRIVKFRLRMNREKALAKRKGKK